MSIGVVRKKGVSGGMFVADSLSSRLAQVNFGGPTDIIITPPAGQRVLLTSLSADLGLSEVNIDVGSRNVLVNKTLQVSSTGLSGEFLIGSGATSTDNQGVYESILGEVDEAIRVYRSNTSATTVRYGYMTGRVV